MQFPAKLNFSTVYSAGNGASSSSLQNSSDYQCSDTTDIGTGSPEKFFSISAHDGTSQTSGTNYIFKGTAGAWLRNSLIGLYVGISLLGASGCMDQGVIPPPESKGSAERLIDSSAVPDSIKTICEERLKEVTFQNSGTNLSWDRGYVHYGYDIGKSAETGENLGFSSTSGKEALEHGMHALAASGVKTARVFLFCDFRAGVHFDLQGNPSFDATVFKDSDTLFESARKNGIKLIPVLMDFHVANKTGTEHPEVFFNAEKRATMEKLFGRYINHYSKTYGDAIQAWDILNEPEFASAVSRRTNVSAKDPRALYLKEMYAVAKKNSEGIPITIGWNRKENAVKFRNYSDLIQAHYYKDGSFGHFLDYLEKGAGGKQVLAGEAGATGAAHMKSMLNEAKKRNVEVLFWDNPKNPEEHFFDYGLFYVKDSVR